MKHELTVMRAQGSGAIVNCSSLGGLVGLPGRAAYHASKHGVIGLTTSAALEYAPRPTRRDRRRRALALQSRRKLRRRRRPAHRRRLHLTLKPTRSGHYRSFSLPNDRLES